MTKIKRIRKLYGIVGALAILAIPYLIMIQSENNNIETAQSLCPFKMLTGFPCPGCGITKSLIFFYEGDFLKSIYYHIFGPFTVLFSVISVIVLVTELLTKKEFFQKILYSKKLAYFLGTTLGFYHFTRIVYFVKTNNLDEILRQSIWK
tara:strand:+ start:44 stop:490 length:447 start_codon:yes stop_codon:yes gene_type:complete